MFNTFKTEEQADELPWLQMLDAIESRELWDRPREERAPWTQYLTQADDILAKPRSAVSEVWILVAYLNFYQNVHTSTHVYLVYNTDVSKCAIV